MAGKTQKQKPFQIVPIEKVDVYETILAQLNALISESEMQPGDRLPSERELAERLGVSRVSVREALRTLESMGKIEIRRNSGSFVVDRNGNTFAAQLKSVIPIDLAFLQHLVDVRAAVEDKVVALVTDHAAADLSKVRVVLERAEAELSEPRELGGLDLRFEAALAQEVNNPLLVEMQKSVHQLWIEAWSTCRIAPGDRHLLHKEHLSILEALEEGNGKLARLLMADHVDRTVEDAARVQDW